MFVAVCSIIITDMSYTIITTASGCDGFCQVIHRAHILPSALSRTVDVVATSCHLLGRLLHLVQPLEKS